MSESRRPPRLHQDPPSDPERCTVTIYLVTGPPLVTRMSREEAKGLHDELSAVWRRERFGSFTFNEPGKVTAINPAHIVSVELR